MHPILIELGPLTIRWYGVFMALGFLAGYWMFQKRASAIGLTPLESSKVVIWVFIGGILGAKIYYLLLNWKADPKELVQLRSGFVFFGGFFGGCLALLIWAHYKKRPMAPFADALALSLAIGQVFGRLGCFMNGCCYGKICDHFWGVRLHPSTGLAEVTVHPTQLYEAIGLLNIFFTLWILGRLRRYPGYVAWSYVILYSVLRFFVEFFRGDLPCVLMGRFTLAQGICAILFFLAWIVSARLGWQHAKLRGRSILKQ